MNAHALHQRAEGAEAVKILLRRLRQALIRGDVEIDVPVVLVGRTVPRMRAGALRHEVIAALGRAVRVGTIEREQAQILVERFALDGQIRDTAQISTTRAIGRETMRVRYRAALEVLADDLARMPLVLRPRVTLTAAQREYIVAQALSSSISGAPPHDPTMLAYLFARARHRVLGEPAPHAPGQGRSEDRRWQRAGDRLAAVAEDRLDKELAEGSLLLPRSREIAAVRAWLRDSDPAKHPGPSLSAAVLGVLLHTPESISDLDIDPIDLLSSFFDLPLHMQMAAVSTAHDTANTPLRIVNVALLEFSLGESLADHGYPSAAEHVLRRVTRPIERAIGLPVDVQMLLREFRLHRFGARCALHLAHGPSALDQLRRLLLSYVDFLNAGPEQPSLIDAARCFHAGLNVEIAAALAGADADDGRAAWGRFSEPLASLPGELDPAIEESWMRARRDLETLWTHDPNADRQAIARRLATRLSGPAIESKVATDAVVARWDPRLA